MYIVAKQEESSALQLENMVQSQASLYHFIYTWNERNTALKLLSKPKVVTAMYIHKVLFTLNFQPISGNSKTISYHACTLAFSTLI